MNWLRRALEFMIRETGKASVKPHRITMDVYLRARIEEDSHEGYTPLETLKWELDFLRIYDMGGQPKLRLHGVLVRRDTKKRCENG